MNGNSKYFEQKFNDCSKLLMSKPNDIVSLKYRDIRDHDYYTELLDKLHAIRGIKIENIGRILNGQAYSVSYGEQKIILVEHETGLEILYISGSIASLIALVLQVGTMISDHRRKSTPFQHDHRETEIRYFDEKGNFIEEHRENYMPYEAFLLPASNDKEIELLKKRIDKLQKEVDKLTAKTINKKKK